jgi:hypothetical protein
VTGTIRACETRINPATERAFWRIRLETYGGEIDILAAPDVVAGEPTIGGIVRAVSQHVAHRQETSEHARVRYSGRRRSLQIANVGKDS